MKRVTALLIAAVAGAGLLTGTATAAQRVDWKACGDKDLDAAGAQCAEVAVPLDYRQPRGRAITVAISRLKATDPGQRRGIMLSNPGGPGGPGLGLMLEVRARMSPDVQARYDLIGMDPRGIGRSTPVNCDWPVGNMLRSAGLDRAAFERNARLEAELARRCADTQGETIRHITTRNTARDMDLIRAALGEPKISYLGYSYGTYLGSVYTQLFPHRSDRIVLDSAVDSKRYPGEMIQDMGPANEQALDDWANWAAGQHAEYRLGRTGKQVRALVEDLIRQAARQPIRIGDFRVDEHVLPMVLFDGLADVRENAEFAGSIRQLADAAAGKTVRPNQALERVLGMHYLKYPQAQQSGMAALMCGDASSRRNPERYWRDIQRSRTRQPVFGPMANNLNACAFWAPPVEPPVIVRNPVPALIVQATGDTRTVYDSGVDLHRAMSGSRLVTLQDVRTHSVFGFYPNTCVENAVNTYLRDGLLPGRDLTCRGD
ncbi:alpha/beta hydrolase [Crossiella cryophila]|uniref:Pimeloyl-ACP methyl ester carboxylesterase n=1 Tax=Crossiella cryophila TaxID=43355 RepID=A0A7W7C9P5_9PSEU|nr:alpha/beta hydrolase [Crossiella cryophila]MBB4677127.1 pimeloyl-ACP methyl ester carboxylesterase [Crossiella cryophila]